MVLLIAPPVPIGTGALVQVIAECHSNPKQHGKGTRGNLLHIHEEITPVRNGELDEQLAQAAKSAQVRKTKRRRYELFRGKLTDATFRGSESNLAEFIKARDNTTTPCLAALM
jgi:hypothetical protein